MHGKLSVKNCLVAFRTAHHGLYAATLLPLPMLQCRHGCWIHEECIALEHTYGCVLSSVTLGMVGNLSIVVYKQLVHLLAWHLCLWRNFGYVLWVFFKLLRVTAHQANSWVVTQKFTVHVAVELQVGPFSSLPQWLHLVLEWSIGIATMWVSSVTHQLTWGLGRVLACTGIFEVFKHLLCAIHPNFFFGGWAASAHECLPGTVQNIL